MKQDLRKWISQVGPAPLLALLELCPDQAAFVVDAERNVLAWSPGAERLLGFSAAEVVGSHCLKGVRCPACLSGCALEYEAQGQIVELHDRAGRPLQMERWGRGLRDAEGRFLGGVELLRPRSAPPAARPTEEGVELMGLWTRDPVMLQAFDAVRLAAETEASVLVRGESGSGKELMARAIHALSPRAAGPFVAVNCAALTPGLVESELFGHVRGAYTGAVSDRRGIFEQAQGGTLFLDEVAELPLEMQARLLRVLQERELRPVGSNRRVQVDVRVVAATHKALREEVKAGRFREDLMFRLRVVPIFLPPLRERRGDIELLLQRFIAEANRRGRRRVERVEPEAMARLMSHAWPGNVRELQNVVEYAFAVGRGPELRADELPPEFREGAPDLPSPARSGEPSAEELRRALDEAGGHVGRAAERLGMSRPTFWRWRRKLLGP